MLTTIRVPANAPPLLPSTPQQTTGPNLLDAFTHGLGAEEFGRRFYGRTGAVAFVGANPARVRALLEDYLLGGDVAALTEASPSDDVSAWLATGASVKVSAGAAAAMHCAKAASLYFRAPVAACAALVPSIAEPLGLAPAALYYEADQTTPRGEVEVFASRAGHVTAWHTDFQNNFTIQLSGRKKWRLVAGGAAPLRARTPHFDTPGNVVEEQATAASICGAPDAGFTSLLPPPTFFAGADEVVLNPGDTLYFPAGAWHAVECESESLSINISIVGLTWADIASSAIRTILWRSAGMRQVVGVEGVSMGAGGGSLTNAEAGAGAGAGTGAGMTRKRARTNRAHAHHAIDFRDHRAAAECALRELKAVVEGMRVEDLLPPALSVSRRFSDIRGSDFPGVDPEGEEATSFHLAVSSTASDSVARLGLKSVSAHFEEGVLVLVPNDTGCDGKGSRSLALNSNAILIDGALRNAYTLGAASTFSGQPKSRGPATFDFVVVVGFGSVVTGEDIAPLGRTIIRVSSRFAGLMRKICAASRGDERCKRGTDLPVLVVELDLWNDALLEAIVFAGLGS